MAKRIQGLITALITPFHAGAVDYDSFRRLLHQQIASGVDGFVVNGTTGESPALERAEVQKLYELTRQEAGAGRFVILGTGTNNTQSTVEMTRWAANLGADAALVVTPYYNKPPQRGLVAHFQRVADESQIPVVLYNVPGRTITALSRETVFTLSQHKNICGIKEASGEFQLLEGLKKEVRDDFVWLSGDDGTCVEFCRRGGDGVIAVASHILGEPMKQALQKAKSEAPGAANAFNDKYKRLIDLLYCESNPIPVKAALKIAGVIRSAELRLPLVELAEEWKVKLAAEMKSCGI